MDEIQLNIPDSTRAILLARSDYVKSLSNLAAELESTDSVDESALEVAEALYAKSSIEKFKTFWFESIDTENFIREEWPDLSIFTPLDFELLIKRVLQVVDGDAYILTSTSHDQGIDLFFERKLDPDFDSYSKTVIQCKLYRGYVPVTDLRDFFGVMAANVAKGLFVTTGKLTSQGLSFLPLANESSFANRLHVIELSTLRDVLWAAENLVNLILDDTVDPEEESQVEAWIKHIDSLRSKSQMLIWSKPTEVIQHRLL